MFDRRLIQHFDWILLTVLGMLAAISVLNLYSATYSMGSGAGSHVFAKQVYWFLIGFGVLLIMTTFNYFVLERLAYPAYMLVVVLLIWVLVAGKETSGSQRWLALGAITFQPSEPAKLAVIMVLAKFFSAGENHREYRLRDLWQPLLIIIIPALLILQEPDLGTGLLLVIVSVSVILFVKVNWRSVVISAVSVLCVSPLVWFQLKSYQKTRILSFLNPEMDPLGSGYHINQSKIAIGSGEFWGKGLLKGTQTRLHFLPEQHTDFAFSVLAEEWGFFGSIILLLLYLFVILWGLGIARNSKDRFGSILAVGIVAIIFWQVAINVAMVTGLLPVVGIPLLLFSYGGSSLITTMTAMGLLMNISMRRFMFYA